jgi:hypothetical protein
MRFDRLRAGGDDVVRRLSLGNKLFRSEPRLTVRRCTARQLDGHLRLETEDR